MQERKVKYGCIDYHSRFGHKSPSSISFTGILYWSVKIFNPKGIHNYWVVPSGGMHNQSLQSRKHGKKINEKI